MFGTKRTMFVMTQSASQDGVASVNSQNRRTRSLSSVSVLRCRRQRYLSERPHHLLLLDNSITGDDVMPGCALVPDLTSRHPWRGC